MIHIELYLAQYKSLKQRGLLDPKADYLIITRTANSVLSPSRSLLSWYKQGKITFEDYLGKFLYELLHSEPAKTKIAKIQATQPQKDIYLICYEKDPSKCHRSLVKAIIENPYWNNYTIPKQGFN